MGEILLSGLVSGGSTVSAGHVFELDDGVAGDSQVSGTVVLIKGTHGYLSGTSGLALWASEMFSGYGRLMGTFEVVRTPLPLSAAQVQKCFRWGQQFGPGDLEFGVPGCAPLGVSCVSYTIYWIQRGCAPKQVGPRDRRPIAQNQGVYYATGTAGECGQPGLWMLRWCYRETIGGPAQYAEQYFYVLDSVLCPVVGDTLPRVVKWGWD